MFPGAIDVALGAGAAGAYTNSSELWTHLEKVHHFQRKLLCVLHGKCFSEPFPDTTWK